MTTKTGKTKKMTPAQKRKARNEYSRRWKAENKEKVQGYNRAWYEAQRKVKAKKAAKKKATKKAGPAAKKTTRKATVTEMPNGRAA